MDIDLIEPVEGYEAADMASQGADGFREGFLYAIKRLEADGFDASAETLKEIYDKEVS